MIAEENVRVFGLRASESCKMGPFSQALQSGRSDIFDFAALTFVPAVDTWTMFAQCLPSTPGKLPVAMFAQCSSNPQNPHQDNKSCRLFKVQAHLQCSNVASIKKKTYLRALAASGGKAARWHFD
jgi:hypothetical protein